MVQHGDTLQQIAALIQAGRSRSGKTIGELADASELTRDRVSDIEAGLTELSATEFVRLAWAIGASPAALV